MGLDRVKAVLLDALGTLVELPAPAPALVEELAARGVEVGEDDAARAIRTEIAYYRAEHHVASTPGRLAELRVRCTEVLRDALPAHAREAPDLGGALLGALRFRPYPEVVATLEAWRERGVRRVVASNWDVSLHEVLATTGLAPLLDGVVTSAELGIAKPDPRLLLAALEVAGAEPGDALHVGDSVEHDVGAAHAAGVAVALVARPGDPRPDAPPGVRVVGSLDALL